MEDELGRSSSSSSILNITYMDFTSSQVFANTYNSRNYPNDDILKMSTNFVVNLRTDMLRSNKISDGDESNDVHERKTRESNLTEAV